LETLDLFTHAARRAEPEYPAGIPRDVCDLFEKLARDVIERGFEHYSSDALLHRIRWHYHVERGHRSFKANNNWTAGLARWWIKRHPEQPKFFELRERT
jgi:hypothetical protein